MNNFLFIFKHWTFINFSFFCYFFGRIECEEGVNRFSNSCCCESDKQFNKRYSWTVVFAIISIDKSLKVTFIKSTFCILSVIEKDEKRLVCGWLFSELWVHFNGRTTKTHTRECSSNLSSIKYFKRSSKLMCWGKTNNSAPLKIKRRSSTQTREWKFFIFIFWLHRRDFIKKEFFVRRWNTNYHQITQQSTHKNSV